MSDTFCVDLKEKDLRIKKLQETLNSDIEQEKRKAKMDKESAIKLVYLVYSICVACLLVVS